jgi:hypothetical protein
MLNYIDFLFFLIWSVFLYMHIWNLHFEALILMLSEVVDAVIDG